MTASIQTPADLVNLALQRIGYAGRIANLYDGSKAAQDALDVYAQTRDEMLRGRDWPFASRTDALTLLKTAPAGGYGVSGWTSAYPAIPWLFEYAYPDDALEIRLLKAVPLFVPNFDPQPNNFSIANDKAFSPPRRVVLSNIASAVAIYTARVTDPSSWPVDFVEAFAASLGKTLAPALANPEMTKLAAVEEQSSTAQAETQQG